MKTLKKIYKQLKKQLDAPKGMVFAPVGITGMAVWYPSKKLQKRIKNLPNKLKL